MNFRLGLFLLLAPAALFAAAAAPGIEFNGVIVDPAGKTTVSLLNPVTGEAKWVAVGSGKFSGYVVTSYAPDPKAGDAVILTKDGSTQTLRVVLKGAVIVATPDKTPSPVPVTAEQKAAVAANLQFFSVAAEAKFRLQGKTSVTFEELIGDNPSSFPPIAGENYHGMVIRKGEPIKVTMPDGSVISFGP